MILNLVFSFVPKITQFWYSNEKDLGIANLEQLLPYHACAFC